MKGFSTQNWIIGILIAAFVSSFVVGFLHGVGFLSEPESPIVHTFRDWIIVAVIVVPISYLVARILPQD